MADAEIEILLTLTSQITKSLDDAKKSIEGTTNSLLAVGNAASSVDSIFSSLTSISLRLENAHERLANAEDRLEDAQTRLNRLQKSGKATSEQLEDAQKDLDRATRGLTISQNNLARAQNQVIGTYINVGIQSVRLIQSLPQLKKAIDDIRIASQAFVATPLGLALLAIGAALAVGAIAYKGIKKEAEEFKDVSDRLIESQRKLADKINITNVATQKALQLTFGIFEEKSLKELELERDIAMFREEIAKAKLRNDDKEVDSLEDAMAIREEQLEVERTSRESIIAEGKVTEKLATKYQTLASDNVLAMPWLAKMEYLQGEYLVNFQNAMNEETRILSESVNAQIAELARLERAKDGAISSRSSIPGLSRTRQPTAAENKAMMSFASTSDVSRTQSKNLFNRGI